MAKMKTRVVMEYCYNRKMSPQNTYEEMKPVFGDECPSRVTVHRWHLQFQRGQTSLEDAHRSGRPADVTTDVKIEAVNAHIMRDGRITVKRLAEILTISESTVLRIIHDKLGMKKLSARWIPRLLTAEQRYTRIVLKLRWLL